MVMRASKALERQLRANGVLPPKEKQKRGMNKTEAAYAELLHWRLVAGEIQWFAFEPIRLRLADGTFYKPDFWVQLAGVCPMCFRGMNRSQKNCQVCKGSGSVLGKLEVHETKGHMREAARVRLRVAAELYPWRFVIVRKVKEGWEFETVPGKRN